jgi:serine/threonine protein phosphatase PrpC
VNWIGSSVHSRYITGYDQIRTDTVVYSGSRLIICSDGITGDIEKDRVSDEELSFCFSLKSPQEVADALVVVSRADDDKTALVIDLE